MLDLHCHILPGVDDGAASLDEALAMARFCVADGITHVVATRTATATAGCSGPTSCPTSPGSTRTSPRPASR